MKKNFFCLVLSLTFLIGGCAQTIQQQVKGVVQELRPGQSVAVAPIYDEQSGDVTALGDYLAGRVEEALREKGVPVKARGDLKALVLDQEFFGKGIDEEALFQKAGADILLAGSYAIIKKGNPAIARLTLKGLRAADGSIIQTRIQKIELPPDWARLAGVVKNNVYQNSIERMNSSGGENSGPRLKAHFSKMPACFTPGEASRIVVHTEPGVHLYLIDLAADRTATLLYPNALLADRKLPTANFTFPPDALQDRLQLLFYPLHEGQTSQESIKVIASYAPLDFTWLPVPAGQIYAGARGGNLKRIAKVLKSATGWSETVLNYYVGSECQ